VDGLANLAKNASTFAQLQVDEGGESQLVLEVNVSF
jgi:hypothetical protein